MRHAVGVHAARLHLRGTNIDRKVATPAEIARMRAFQIGHQVDGITGGPEVKDQK